MLCESELPTPDPADEAALYPTTTAWEPMRRPPRRLRSGGRLQAVHGAARPEWVRTTAGLARPGSIQAHGMSFEYPIGLSGTPEFRSTETTNLVEQSAFLKPPTSAQVVTQCTMFPRVQFLGVHMQKPAVFSARTISNTSATSLPGLSATGFANASAIHRPQRAGFQHSVPPLLTAERLNGFGARWLQSLSVTVRPLITAKRHPHIVNKFAILWGDDDAVEAYFDELLISARPGRRGFAMEVLDELVELQRAVQEQRRF
jgi:hypothetical protein